MCNCFIKEGFILRKISDCNIIMPTGKNIKNFHHILLINETGAMIYEQLKQEKNIEEIAKSIVAEYDIAIKKALEDVKVTIELLKREGLISENKDYSTNV